MLVDEVEIKLQAGNGGPGKVSFYPGKKSGPDGGNGGKGGDVYLATTTDLMALGKFTKNKIIQADSGQPGESNRKFGKNGEDITIYLPLGSELTDLETGEVINLDQAQQLLTCKGGLGGRGNYEFKSSRQTTPEYAQPGLPGQSRTFKVSLKLIADYGLIGLPSAGKSSLLNELTEANAKVGDYPFTTLEPNLGVLNGKVMADIPGLIERASEGKGLGTRFLKHIEKVGTLLHCISAESENPVEDYTVVVAELGSYNKELLNKKQLILLTKADLVDEKELEKKQKEFKKLKLPIIPVSIHDWDSLQKLIRHL